MPEPTTRHETPPGTDQSTGELTPHTEPATQTADTPPGYELVEEIGRGGMGVVYRVRDLALSRDVAVKVLQARYAADSPAARRFASEVRITGQLQHPAIPAVHQVGTLPDGRPFLVMKLVKGHTLDAELRDRPELAHDRGRFVAVFEQVCLAVAYAHAHRVIHRDLKPLNVMVGKFGEVQVMDWGLAKVLTTPADPALAPTPEPSAAETEIRSDRETGSETQAGTLVGTPAYVAPEQAGGEVARVDERADVFGLGAVLTTILTGRPPYHAADGEAVRLMAVRGQLADAYARLDACGAEPELVALCKRCLAVDPADRPRDAGEVARAVAGLRQEAESRARRAEAEAAAAAARADEQRRKRRWQLAAAAAGVLLLAIAGAGAWWADRQANAREYERSREVDRNRQAALAALEEAEAALGRGDMPVADAALAQASRRISEAGLDDLRERLTVATRDRTVVRELRKVLDHWMTQRGPEGNLDAPYAVREYPEVFARYGIDPADPPAAAAAIRRSRVSAALLDGFGNWFSADRRRPGLLATLDLLDPDPDRTALRAALAAKDADRIRELAARLDGAAVPPWFADTVGDHSALPVNEAVRILSAAWRAHPNDSQAPFTIAYRLLQARRAAEAIPWARVAVALRPDSGAAWGNLGTVFLQTRNLAEAEVCFRRLIELDRADAMGFAKLSAVYYLRGDRAGAEEYIRRAAELEPGNAQYHGMLAIHQSRRGDTAGMEASYLKALAADPKFPRAHFEIGWIREGRGDVAGAAEFYRKAVEVDPKDAESRRLLNQAETALRLLPRLPDVLAGRAEPADAREYCDFALLCAKSYQRRFAAAVRLYERAFALDPKLADDLGFATRYYAATHAVRAGAGDAVDAPPDPRERAALRAKALEWLWADLVLRKKQAASGALDERHDAADSLDYWLTHPPLAWVRPGLRRIGLPADERAAWDELWAEVEATIDEIDEPLPLPREVKRP